jgi:alpha,alpha-trehalase
MNNMVKKSVLTGLIILGCAGANGQSSFPAQSSYDLKEVNKTVTERWKDEITVSKNLPHPYITAFKNDQYMYYWDTYFINRGLLVLNHLGLAKQNVLNLLNIVHRYGFVGNASVTTWGMNRSQPPYLSLMVRDIYKQEKDIQFLRDAYPLLKKEYQFWTADKTGVIEHHHTPIKGLQRYSHHATDNELVALYNSIADRLNLDTNIPDSQKANIASEYAAEAESGMDFTSRFEGLCTEFIAVDLNCLLYALEKNMDWMRIELKLSDEPDWSDAADQRKGLINKYCWDEKTGMYYDFNFKTGKKSKVAAVTTFQPLWVGMATKQQATKVMNNLSSFVTPYGLTTTIKGSNDEMYQWGSLSVWAPMQLIAAEGMLKYGYKKEAKALALSYLQLIAKNYYSPVSSRKDRSVERHMGKTYEKYTALGTINDTESTAGVMMGWTAGVYNCLYQLFDNL